MSVTSKLEFGTILTKTGSLSRKKERGKRSNSKRNRNIKH